MANGPNTPATLQAVSSRRGWLRRGACRKRRPGRPVWWRIPSVHGEGNHGRAVEHHQPSDRRVGAHRVGGEGYRQVEQRAQGKEAVEGVLAPQVVGDCGPEEPPAHIEDADHQHVAGGEGRRHDVGQCGAEYVGHHRLGHADDTDSGGHVEAEDYT